MTVEFLKNSEIQHIAREGTKIYQKIKSKYDPKKKGKFLAIDVDTKETYFGNTSIDAMNRARKSQPGKVFYLVKIGFDSIETMASLYNLS